jgi:murein DD-endopeptidase MepM/ murein hydrolase activator NlpD
MNEYFLYIIKVSVVQSVFYFFYVIFLNRRTSVLHQRIFLMVSLIFSFFMPFIRIIHLAYSINIPDDLMKFEEILGGYVIEKIDIVHDGSTHVSWIKILYMIYFAGFMIFFYRFVASIISLFRFIQKGTICRRNGFRLVLSDKAVSPFSFFHFIIINKTLYSEAELRKIIDHEHVHIRQMHSVDILLIEITQLITWFNPVSGLVKKSVKAIHEYIADRHVIESGTDPLEYQMLLMKYHFNNKALNLISYLNVSLIKKRIMILSNYQKTKVSNRRYLLIMPLLVLMFMAFSSQQIIGDKEMMNSSGQLQSENKPGMMPVDKDKVKMTSGYGMRMHPVYKREMMHTGVDFAAPLGTPVMATADGIVMEIADEVYDPKGYGKFIIITHGQTYKTMYAQLSEVLVKEKQSVKKGEMIGKIGESGLSTAPHLHYEVWKNNEKVNPADYFQ